MGFKPTSYHTSTGTRHGVNALLVEEYMEVHYSLPVSVSHTLYFNLPETNLGP